MSLLFLALSLASDPPRVCLGQHAPAVFATLTPADAACWPAKWLHRLVASCTIIFRVFGKVPENPNPPWRRAMPDTTIKVTVYDGINLLGTIKYRGLHIANQDGTTKIPIDGATGEVIKPIIQVIPNDFVPRDTVIRIANDVGRAHCVGKTPEGYSWRIDY